MMGRVMEILYPNPTKFHFSHAPGYLHKTLQCEMVFFHTDAKKSSTSKQSFIAFNLFGKI
jgi:hypothetical protein